MLLTINPRNAETVAIGECMVELARGDDQRFGLAVGGDTFNTAVYLARAGVAVSYATALGDDPYSGSIVGLAQREGVGTSAIARLPGRMPGLYLIETREGERTFYYWRDTAPARELLEGPGAEAAAHALLQAGLIYFSGITLSLYAPRGLDRLADILAQARADGATIVMDSNYRPRGWRNDRARAREVMGRFWPLVDVALPTFDDEALLWADPAPQATATRLLDGGVSEIAVKLGHAGAFVQSRGSPAVHVPAPASITPVDTTGAGDSFNATYLAARMRGLAPDEAALAGHELAGIVIRHRGAIVPREATSSVLSASRAGSPPGRQAP